MAAEPFRVKRALAAHLREPHVRPNGVKVVQSAESVDYLARSGIWQLRDMHDEFHANCGHEHEGECMDAPPFDGPCGCRLTGCSSEAR